MAGDPADAAVLVASLLRLACAKDRDGMIALAARYQGRPEVLGAAAVMLGGELAAMRLDLVAGALLRFEDAAARLAGKGG